MYLSLFPDATPTNASKPPERIQIRIQQKNPSAENGVYPSLTTLPNGMVSPNRFSAISHGTIGIKPKPPLPQKQPA
jgi:hypothetical protein